MVRLYDESFEHKGRTYRVAFPHDDGHSAPWEECDGHGIVSEQKRHPFGHGTKPPKAPGEKILHWECGYYRTYDVAKTLKIAKRDGWGLNPDDEAKLAQTLGRAPTHKEIIAAAVDADFEYLRAWCSDEWHYVGVVVTHESGDSEALWGIESNDGAYLDEVAHELADEIAFRLDAVMAAKIEASRPDMHP